MAIGSTVKGRAEAEKRLCDARADFLWGSDNFVPVQHKVRAANLPVEMFAICGV
jgi:hypothetical protein